MKIKLKLILARDVVPEMSRLFAIKIYSDAASMESLKAGLQYCWFPTSNMLGELSKI